MAASQPASSRADNIRKLNSNEKIAILRSIPLSGSPASLALLKRQIDSCEVTGEPLQISKVTQPHSKPIQKSSSRSQPRNSVVVVPASSWAESAKAGLRGVVDSLPFEGGNYAFAAVNALGDAVTGKDLRSALARRLKAERAQDHYDEAHHPTARLVGKVAGNVLQTAVPMLGAARVVRIAPVTPRLLKETGKLMGAGGVANAMVEGVIEGVNGKFSPTRILGAAAGGALGTFAALKGKPGAAGAATGAATSLIQDALDGNLNSNSMLRASDAAAAGSLLAGGGGRLAARQANKLPNTNPGGRFWQSKGDLGEELSQWRTKLRGDRVVETHQPVRVQGGKTIADHLTALGETVEAKFGRYAKLSPRQREAFEQIIGYRVDHFLPRDIGAIVETPLGMLAYQGQNEFGGR